MTDSRGTTVNEYDSRDRLTKTTNPDGGITSYAYDNAGNRKLIIYPNGTRSEYFYDSLNRLTGLENRNSGGVISGYTYTLGASGNRTKVSESGGRVVNYGYDSLYRLVSEQISDPVKGNESVSYTYDAFGNRLTKTDSSGTTSYVYDANDRLVTESGVSGTTTYSYDANGNTLSKTGADSASYAYNAENRLVSVNNSAGQTEYQYDASGIRVSSSVNGTATKYIVDKNRDYAQVLEERTGSGALEARYTYGDDLISQNRSGSSSFYLYDGQLSTRQLTDSSGAVTDTYTYDAFGVQLSKTGTTLNNYRYTGEQLDPNAGFYYLRARYYDQNDGRFLTVDPFEGKPFEPLTLHKYTYTGNNPVMFIDPSGEFFGFGDLSISQAIRNILDRIQSSSAATMFRIKATISAPVLLIRARLVNPSSLKFTDTIKDYIVTRPYMDYNALLHWIIRSGNVEPDPGGVKTAVRYVAYGMCRIGSNGKLRDGFYELVIDLETNRILHYLFKE